MGVTSHQNVWAINIDSKYKIENKTAHSMGLESLLLGFDRLGQPVTVKHKGKGSFNTYFGAVVSSVTSLIVLVYILV